MGTTVLSGQCRRHVAEEQIDDPCGQVGDGGPGIEVDGVRIYRDVRLMRLYEGTSEIQRLIIGGGLVRAEKKKQS